MPISSIRFLAALYVGFALACSPETDALPEQTESQSVADSLHSASQLIAEQKGQEAVDLLQPLFLSHPENRELNLVYARALMQTDRISVATWHLQRAAEKEGAAREVVATYIYAMAAGGAEQTAVEVADAVLADEPDADAIRFQRISALAAVMRKDEALDDLAYLLDKKPDALNLLQAQFNLEVELDRFEEARATLARIGEVLTANEAPPEQLRQYCAARGKFELDRREFETARAIFEDCLTQKPDDVDVIFLMEELIDAQQKTEDATAYLEAAAKRLPRHLRIQLRLASRYFRLGEEEKGADSLIQTARRIGSTTAWLALADRRVLTGDLPKAVDAIDKAIRAETGMEPSDPEFDWRALPVEAAFAFGDVFIRAGEFDRAREIIEVVEKEEKVYGLLLDARLQLVQGDPAAALATYDEAFKYNPSNPGARYLAGRAAMETGDFERSASLYQDALRADASANDAGLVLARMQLAQGLPGACIDTLGFYMRLNQDQPHGLRLFAQAASALGFDAPAAGARERLHDNPAWAGVALADHAAELAARPDGGGAQSAADYLEASGEIELPSHFQALTAWVDAMADLDRLDSAATRVDRLSESHPEAAGFQIALGHVRQEQGRWDDAIRAYRRATDLAPAIPAGHIALGNALAALDQTDEALEAFERASRLDLLDPEPGFRAAEVAIETGRLEDARRLLKAVLIQHPWHGAAALELARLRGAAGEWDDQTRILAEQAVRFLGVSGPEALSFHGRYLLQIGEAGKAVPRLQRAIAMGRSDTNTRFLLARALHESGRAAAARSELESLLSAPTNSSGTEESAAEPLFEERDDAVDLLERIIQQEAVSP